MDTTSIALGLAAIRTLNGEQLMLSAMRALIAQTKTHEDLKTLTEVLRAGRDDAAPNGYAMRPYLSPYFLALREAYGEAMTALYEARENAGLHRFETHCTDCRKCAADKAAGGVQ